MDFGIYQSTIGVQHVVVPPCEPQDLTNHGDDPLDEDNVESCFLGYLNKGSDLRLCVTCGRENLKDIA